jgi:hypothetical protein
MAGNCVLSYSNGGTINSFRVWCTGYNWGFEQLGSESSARRFRAFYPRRVAPSKFSVTLALKANTTRNGGGYPVPGTSDYDRFGKFMADYYNYMLELQDSAGSGGTSYKGLMLVNLVGRGWARFGIPISGVSYGDHVGSLLWTPTLVFETALDPLDTQQDIVPAQYNNPVKESEASKYFYPWSEFAFGDRDSSILDEQQKTDYRINSGPPPSNDPPPAPVTPPTTPGGNPGPAPGPVFNPDGSVAGGTGPPVTLPTDVPTL